MVHLLLVVIYLAFISLGLPDSLLGSAWPMMYQEFEVPVSYAGIIAMIIAAGTIVSSLLSDRLTRKLGPGMVTALSVALTAFSLFGFSVSNSFILLCILAIPYGLGAGSVDAALNNYVALHYDSHHMSWLHCMWGLGASIGPYIMSYALIGGKPWNTGYQYVSYIQIGLTFIIFLSLPLWKKRPVVAGVADSSVDGPSESEMISADTAERALSKTGAADAGVNPSDKPLTLREIYTIPGAKQILITFFCYCALETTCALWASSYLVLSKGIDAETAAALASLFYIGITVGRAISGFLTFKFNDIQMVRMGECVIGLGILTVLLPFGEMGAMVGLVLIGLGCAPIYPCIIHSTPVYFWGG